MLCEGCELEEDDPDLLAAKVSLGVLDVVYQVCMYISYCSRPNAIQT